MTFGADGTGGLPPPIAGADGLAGADGFGGTPGLAGMTGFGFGAGAGPLLPMTLLGRDPPGVEVGDEEFWVELPIRELKAAARAAAPPPAPFAAGAAAGVGRAGGGLLAGGGGGGAARSINFRLQSARYETHKRRLTSLRVPILLSHSSQSSTNLVVNTTEEERWKQNPPLLSFSFTSTSSPLTKFISPSWPAKLYNALYISLGGAEGAAGGGGGGGGALLAPGIGGADRAAPEAVGLGIATGAAAGVDERAAGAEGLAAPGSVFAAGRLLPRPYTSVWASNLSTRS